MEEASRWRSHGRDGGGQGRKVDAGEPERGTDRTRKAVTWVTEKGQGSEERWNRWKRDGGEKGKLRRQQKCASWRKRYREWRERERDGKGWWKKRPRQRPTYSVGPMRRRNVVARCFSSFSNQFTRSWNEVQRSRAAGVDGRGGIRR